MDVAERHIRDQKTLDFMHFSAFDSFKRGWLGGRSAVTYQSDFMKKCDKVGLPD
jgi:hypothetical protein